MRSWRSVRTSKSGSRIWWHGERRKCDPARTGTTLSASRTDPFRRITGSSEWLEARCAISNGGTGSNQHGSCHSTGLLALRTQLRLEGSHSFQTFGSPDPCKKESLPHGSILRRTYRLVKGLCVLFIFRRMI